jgi:hypothetical protein
MFCNYNTGKSELVCTDVPYQFVATYPNFSIRKLTLPIILGGSLDMGYQHITHYNDIPIFDDIASSIGESNQACHNWNCLCGDFNDEEPTMLKYSFTSDPHNFLDRGKNPKTEVGMAISVLKGSDGNCEVDVNSSVIYFNITPEFIYGSNYFPTDTYGTFFRGYVSQKYKNNANLVPKSVKLYSYLELVSHELGHLLGFGHYDIMHPTGMGQMCDNGEIQLYGMMHSEPRDIRDEFITELFIYDKCMFAKLYCPANVDIDDETIKPANVNVFPNPTKKELNIEFELEYETLSVSISICNAKGDVIQNIISKELFQTGKNIYTTQLNLTSGSYFAIIQIGNKLIMRQFIFEK